LDGRRAGPILAILAAFILLTHFSDNMAERNGRGGYLLSIGKMVFGNHQNFVHLDFEILFFGDRNSRIQPYPSTEDCR
jgi:hypothetical protein